MHGSTRRCAMLEREMEEWFLGELGQLADHPTFDSDCASYYCFTSTCMYRQGLCSWASNDEET